MKPAAAVLLLFLAACGSAPETRPPLPTPPEREVIVLWRFTCQRDRLHSLLDRWVIQMLIGEEPLEIDTGLTCPRNA